MDKISMKTAHKSDFQKGVTSRKNALDDVHRIFGLQDRTSTARRPQDEKVRIRASRREKIG
jgi:hypothetical protein